MDNRIPDHRRGQAEGAAGAQPAHFAKRDRDDLHRPKLAARHRRRGADHETTAYCLGVPVRDRDGDARRRDMFVAGGGRHWPSGQASHDKKWITARRAAFGPRAGNLEMVPDGFGITSATLDAMFRKAKEKVGIEGMTFHDTRHEAITRLAKKLHVLDLARMVGHSDIRQLQAYYNETAADIAARL